MAQKIPFSTNVLLLGVAVALLTTSFVHRAHGQKEEGSAEEDIVDGVNAAGLGEMFVRSRMGFLRFPRQADRTVPLYVCLIFFH